jgi:hypothetical protein
MAAKKRNGEGEDQLGALDKIARLFAAHITRGMKPDEATLIMEGAGFTDREITELLGVSDSYVRQVRFQRNAKKGSKKKPKAG